MEKEKTAYFALDHGRFDTSPQANNQVTRPQRRPLAERMRRFLGAPWLHAIVFACLFLGVLGRSATWPGGEFVMQNPTKSQETLQDLVSGPGLRDNGTD
jgi:hypothetical protein